MLEIKKLKKSYSIGKEEVPVLKGIDFAVEQGTFLALLGPSGCGKSTLLNILGGLDGFDEGEIIADGENLTPYYNRKKDEKLEKYRLENIGTIFQSFNLISHMTALQNVEVPLKLAGVSKEEMHTRAKELLGKVGLEDRINYKPAQLSGGQKQRVAIARALALNPNIILADEPTGALDTKTSEQVMELLKEIAKENGTTIIMVTHDPDIAKQADRIIRMKDGEIVQEETLREPSAKKEVKKNKFKNMSLVSSIKHANQAMFQKKWRNLLVSVGGSVGIAGIALIVGLGMGIEDKVKSIMSEFLDQNAIIVTQDKDGTPLTYEQGEKIEQLEQVKEVQHSYAFTIQIENAKHPLQGGTVGGITEKQSNSKMMKSFLANGTFPEETNEIALSKQTATLFAFKGQKPEELVGQQIELSLVGLENDPKGTVSLPFKVSGKAVESTYTVTGITNTESYVVHEATKALSEKSFNGTPTPLSTMVIAKTIEDVEGTKKEIGRLGFVSETNEELMKEMSKYSFMIQAALGAFAGISLLVSTIMIGIVLYISVIERVKEIGVLRAIGARKKDIRRIFLTEAALIGFFAAVIGIAFSGTGVLIGNVILKNFLGEAAFKAFTLPASLIAFCLIFSVLLSMFAGIIPALKATKLNPVEALRHE